MLIYDEITPAQKRGDSVTMWINKTLNWPCILCCLLGSNKHTTLVAT